MIEMIIKRDGRMVSFDRDKITLAVLSAAIAVGGRDRRTAEDVTEEVIQRLELKQKSGRDGRDVSYPTVEEVQDLVEKSLIERGHAKTAKAYIIYRYEHTLKRSGRKSLTYSSENIPYQKLWQTLVWGVDHTCVSLNQIKRIIEEGGYPDLVEASESFYSQELDEAVRIINDRLGEIRIIIVSGPSSSGKTTTTIKIAEKLKDFNYSLVALNVDNYYHDLASHPRDSSGDFDYETPQAIDLALVNRHLKELLEGGTIEVPYYNFKTGNREGVSRTLTLESNQIILIDSLHGMFDEMTLGIPDETKFKLYIETLSQLKGDDNRFIRWADIRLLRRMVRDMQFRNYNPGQTLAHWHYVRRSELRYIVAQLPQAHVVVNSFLPYELPIMKNRLSDLFPGFIEQFSKDPDREDASQRARRVADIFRQIPAWSDESIVGKHSLLREFIGGSGYTY